MSIKGSISLIFALLFASKSIAQNTKKIYFIEKINTVGLFKNMDQSQNLQLVSAAVEMYDYQNGIKRDSMTLHAENFFTWKDSVAFQVGIPDSFFTIGHQVTLLPIYHLKKNGSKGTLPSFVVGDEQKINSLQLKIKSNPSGAKVYLIPKLYWDRNPDFAKFKVDVLFPYQVSEGNTPITTYVQEYVYIAVFKYQSRFLVIPCSPNHLHEKESLFADFNN